MTTRILCVCLGNICRSPSAQAVLQSLLPGARIDSAGTGGWHAGDPPYPPAIRAAAARGYDLSAQRARQVTGEDFDRFDLILAMDRRNLADLQAMAPSGSHATLALFMEHAKTGPRDVPDPYYTRDFEAALDIIETGARAWADQPHMASAVAPNWR